MKSVVWFVAGLFLVAACSATAAIPPTSSTSTTSPPTTTSTTTPELTTTTAIVLPLSGRMIVIDPGHNGMNWAYPDEINQIVDIGTGSKACNTTGTTTYDSYAEPDFTWAVAQLVKPLLEGLGATVTLTRPDNEGWGPCITERAAIGNEFGRDAVVSIHADGGPDDGRGFHVIFPKAVVGLTDDIAGESKRLAEALHATYLETGMPVTDYRTGDGYSIRDDLGGLTLSDSPVVFLEAGNMRNATDAALLQDPAFQEKIADAIVAALLAFLA